MRLCSVTCFETGMVVRPTRYKSAVDEAFGRRVDLWACPWVCLSDNGRWGMALGVAPVSDVNYNISDAQVLEDGPRELHLYR